MGERHPVFEYLVFGLAALMAVLIAYKAFTRWEANHSAGAHPEAPLGRSPRADDSDQQGITGTLEYSDTQPGVTALPAVKLSQPKKRSSR